MKVLKQTFGHRVETVLPGLWQIQFYLPVPTNCWLIKDADGLTLIDAGNTWNAGTILDTIELLGGKLRRIVITHAHPDHAGNAAEIARLTGAAVFAHCDEAAFLETKSTLAEAPAGIGARSLHQISERFGLLAPPRIESVEPLEDGQELGSLQIIHTPGHTPGSISLWLETEKVLFVGDNVRNVFNFLCPNFTWFTLDSSMLRNSIKKYSQFPARILLTGHSPIYRSKDVAKDLLAAC